ncbi:hypothetical protein PR003_g19210 [Phytophthora rubi]|uniref:Uncharacterized protein n=1 Tax=Phytophthora rubi TaxID=129364 RepID=A0A6A3JVA8_9STRA|nr:hypothetical protein PR001_g24852 [Phytophthora rubi]KAE8997237.1 hypothetical protein PR002_g19091 [Phytophthora rubi]KAE9314549.1 hypothetical protein PR003_g19210 [Phytophthora rubi]
MMLLCTMLAQEMAQELTQKLGAEDFVLELGES